MYVTSNYGAKPAIFDPSWLCSHSDPSRTVPASLFGSSQGDVGQHCRVKPLLGGHDLETVFRWLSFHFAFRPPSRHPAYDLVDLENWVIADDGDGCVIDIQTRRRW